MLFIVSKFTFRTGLKPTGTQNGENLLLSQSSESVHWRARLNFGGHDDSLRGALILWKDLQTYLGLCCWRECPENMLGCGNPLDVVVDKVWRVGKERVVLVRSLENLKRYPCARGPWCERLNPSWSLIVMSRWGDV